MAGRPAAAGGGQSQSPWRRPGRAAPVGWPVEAIAGWCRGALPQLVHIHKRFISMRHCTRNENECRPTRHEIRAQWPRTDFFLDLSTVDRRLHDDLRKIFLHLEAPRFDLYRPTRPTRHEILVSSTGYPGDYSASEAAGGPRAQPAARAARPAAPTLEIRGRQSRRHDASTAVVMTPPSS